MVSIKIVLLGLFSFYTCFAQGGGDIAEQFLKMQQEMMKQMMDTNNNFDQDVQKMLEKMQKNGQIDQIPRRFNRGYSSIEYRWEGKSLIIKVNKDDEFNIEIIDGNVHVKGVKTIKTENSFSQRTFSQVIPVDKGLDPASVNMSTKDGNIILKFSSYKDSKRNMPPSDKNI